ncbi:hypothetical protein [Chryseobacterium chendengshani]|uniref:hypothetical protein n=1 Tax=Chryseobacterium sp. LJ756 TaxID=2864113 RepID=UPI001C6405B1|nr:hypothetical protein [Chryseobacterium sp. LJ756]MBW7675546.1 hypothetical protein [Chryseobacterium sp. LJ756]
MKNRYLLFFLLIIVSCNNQKTAMYYYQGKINNGKYILASDLDSFFVDEDMKKIIITEKKIYKELTEIKKKIIAKNQAFDLDDGNYVFAFIKNKDTIFADNRLEFWRYNNRGMQLILGDDIKSKILGNYNIEIK